MAFDLIKTIKQVALDTIQSHALQVLFGKVISVKPLKVKISDTIILTEEFLVLDSEVDKNEEVIVIKYSTGNQYLVLATVEKIHKTTVNTGGLVKVGE